MMRLAPRGGAAGAAGVAAGAVVIGRRIVNTLPRPGPPLSAHLGKHVEYLVERVGADADPIIGHGDEGVIVLAPCAQGDPAGARRVLGGIVEQVADDLAQAGGFGVQRQRARRQVHRPVPASGAWRSCIRPTMSAARNRSLDDIPKGRVLRIVRRDGRRHPAQP